MLIKKQVYPKTKRLPYKLPLIQITGKLDGANLSIGKKDGVIYICTRENIISFDEIDEFKYLLYKDLYSWVNKHIEFFKAEICEGSVINGEWLGMGRLKYPPQMTDKKFFMFAKSRFTEDLDLEMIKRDMELFHYCFKSEIIPEFVSIVPTVKWLHTMPTVSECDNIYKIYTEQVGRNVEGFVINNNDIIHKYVRMKRGKLEKHKE